MSNLNFMTVLRGERSGTSLSAGTRQAAEERRHFTLRQGKRVALSGEAVGGRTAHSCARKILRALTS